jgi:hypothetical protein
MGLNNKLVATSALRASEAPLGVCEGRITELVIVKPSPFGYGRNKILINLIRECYTITFIVYYNYKKYNVL